jgi:hypothetical protein
MSAWPALSGPDAREGALGLARAGRGRPTLALVTTHWGGHDDEAIATTRLVAGALARHAQVEVVHLVAPEHAGEALADSIFPVHREPLVGARPLLGDLVRASLRQAGSGPTPAAIRPLLCDLEGSAPGLGRLLARLAPQVVVLVGRHQPIELALLGRQGTPGAPRVVVLPFTDDLQALAEAPLARLLARAEAIACLHPGEQAALASLGHLHAEALEIGLPLNRSAVRDPLFGVRSFGRYVLLLRSFPPGGSRLARSLTHEMAIRSLGISAAEVDGDRWRVSDAEGTLALPVTPTRINLWRLMAHAAMTIDLRPQGPLGREALESMLLGTPVVVPDNTAAMAHVRAASGGLWYRDIGELLDAARALLDPALRARLGAQGAAYAASHHGRIDAFVERCAALVLGKVP